MTRPAFLLPFQRMEDGGGNSGPGAIVLAAGVFLGLALGIELIPRVYRSSQEQQTRPPAPGRPAPGSSRSSANFDDLLEALSPLAADPLARSFREEFLASPELRGLWNQALQKGDLQALASGLGSSWAFARLFTEFSRRDQRFQELVQGVLDDTRLVPLAQEAGIPTAVFARRTAASQGASGLGDARLSWREHASKVLSALGPVERAAVMSRMERGLPLLEACKDAGLSTRCVEIGDECLRHEDCAGHMAALLRAGLPSGAGAPPQGGGPPTQRGGQRP